MEAHDLNALQVHREHLLTCGTGMSTMIMEAKSSQYAMIMEAIASGHF
jgi:hypothetical protein